MRLSRDVQRSIDALRANIFTFAERAMRFSPTHQQSRLLQKVQDWKDRKPGAMRRIACKSGQGPGKTTCSTVIGLWRTLQHVGAKTVITAPTMRQCRQVWLTECRRRMEKADPWFQQFVNVTKSAVIFANHPHWGVETTTSVRAENAQGHHEDGMTVLIEEGSGIPRDVWEQWEGTMTQGDNLLICIGNPNTRECAFFDCFNRNRRRWCCLTFNAEESPEWLVSRENHEYIAEKYGKNSDVYRVRVLGEFPLEDPRCIISSDWCDRAAARKLVQFSTAKRYFGETHEVARQISLDFARYGSDETVIYNRMGNGIIDQHIAPHEDPNDSVALAFRMQMQNGWHNRDCVFVFDAVGMGEAMIRTFENGGKRFVAFRNNAASFEPEYDNLATLAWFQAARYLKNDLCQIPDDPILISQLSTRYYFVTKKGKIAVETKDDYLKRGFESPDRADAWVMSMFDSVSARARVSARHSTMEAGFGKLRR